MPEIKINSKASVWAPPGFPSEGRLPCDITKVAANYERQTAEENRFRQLVNRNGRKQHSECCHSLHVSLFFDGTNNNDNNDTKKNHPSNVAKLFHAALRGDAAEKKAIFLITCRELEPLFRR